MATTLSAQELERLRQMQALGGNSGWTPQFGQTFGGMDYTPTFDTSGAQGQNASAPSLTGYIRAQEGRNNPGDPYQAFNQSGEFERDGQFKDVKGFEKEFLLAALAMGFGLPALMGQGAGVGSAAGFIGEGALSGVPAWDAALTSALPADLAAAGGMSGAAFGDAGTMYAGADAGAATSLGGGGSMSSVAPVAGGAAGGLGGAGGAGGLLRGAGSLLGPAATVLGAVAGAQGTPGQTQSRTMDPRLDPYVFGTGGLLDLTRGQLQKSMSPQAQAGWDQISNTGLGLLNFTPAGNGFSRFSNR